MVKEFVLTVAVLLYGSGGGDPIERPAQTLRFSDKTTCVQVANVLSAHNWRNPFPVPKTGDYYITRWRVTDNCSEAEAGPASSDVPEKKADDKAKAP